MGVIARWTAPLRRPRFWAIVLAIVVVIRIALPYALRPLVASQASEALRTPVTVGDVDLSLLRGGVALEDVAIGTGTALGDPPIIAWKRFAVNLGWLALLRKTIRLQTVELDSPQVALDRLANGEINLLALVPEAEEAAEEPPADEPGWGLAIDRFALRRGGLRFRDMMVGGAEPLDIDIDEIEVAEVALQPGTYGEPARLHVDVAVDEGMIRIDSRLGIRADGGFDVETDLKARRLPLNRSRVYVPKVGWTSLTGRVGLSVRHHLETGARNELRGGVVVDDLTVLVGGIEQPALGWKRLTVTFDPLDLQNRRAAVGSVDLGGGALVVRLVGDDPLPFLAVTGDGGSDPAQPGTSPSPTPAPPAEPAKPWRWSVGTLRVHDTVAHVYGHTSAPMAVGVGVDVQRLAGEGERSAPVDLALTIGDATLDFDGEARVTPPGVAGKLVIANLALPELVTLVGALPPLLLQRGLLGVELDVAAGSSATPAGDVTVAGTMTLGEPWLAKDDGREFAVGADTIDVGIEEVRLPGLLATPAPETAASVAVKLSALTVAVPYVQLTRTADGMILPAFGPTTGTPATPEPEPAAAPDADTPTATTAAPATVTIDALQLADGRVRVTDRTVQPFWTGDFKPFAFDAKDVHWPELAMDKIRLKATSLPKGTIEVTGSVSPAGGRFEVVTRDVALPPFNPFATSMSPYSITRGRLTVTTKGTFGKGRYDTDTALVLHNFDLGGKEGDSLFQQQFGIPLTTALALMRDLKGDIALDIPVKVDERGTSVGIGTVIAQALRAALLGALTSPLKLIGSAFGGGEGEGPAPVGIPFPTGRAELTGDAPELVDKLGELLASRPGIAITLTSVPTPADVRWLREQALAAELGEPQGVFGAIRNLPARGARDRIRTALEARARDDEGALDEEDAATLEEWLAERGELPADRVQALADARIAAVRQRLVEARGIDASRVRVGEPPAEPEDAQPAEGPPAVTIELGAAGD